ncbi:hypothetical protein ATCC90586_000783 [Pythium insidiosum]|nr:hypothetical protein ATCC90586_000783 [Pythium insidiosum]
MNLWRVGTAFALGLLAGASTASRVVEDATSRRKHSTRRGGAWTVHDENDHEPCPVMDDGEAEAEAEVEGKAARHCVFVEPRQSAGLSLLFSDVVTRLSIWSQADAWVNSKDLAKRPPGKALMMVSRTKIDHMDKLHVTFQLHNTRPTRNDWLGIYCVDESSDGGDVPDSEYIDWQHANGHAVGSVQVGPLTNMRCAWQFRYFTKSMEEGAVYEKLGETEVVRFARGGQEPVQLHLALTENDSEMRVMWTSSKVSAPMVWYGTSPSRLDRSALATARTYDASDMCSSPATKMGAQFFRDPGLLHSAVMTDLEPNTTYFYVVGSLKDGKSATYSFRTPPVPGTQPHTSSFFVYGDLGDWNIRATGPKPEGRTATTIELMQRDLGDPKRDYLAVLHVGDISYAMGRTYLWDQFGAMIEPVASAVPYMVGIGNHEYDYDSGGSKDPSGVEGNGFHPKEGNYGGDSRGECGVPLNKRFIMPDNGNQVFWWSRDIALVHHVMISSEHDYTVGSKMYRWLEQDLANVDRTKTPWIVLHTHRPLYCSVEYPADYKVSLFMREQLEPLLLKYHVDLVFSGHYHSYERTCPVSHGQCRSVVDSGGHERALAPVHIMVGSAGADVDNAKYYDVPWRKAAIMDYGYAIMDYGYGRLHVYNATHAQFEFQHNRNDRVEDETWIITDHKW